MTKLTKEFYLRDDVNQIARDLLGKIVFTRIEGVVSAGKIVETEAYSFREKACHAHMKRFTERTKIMFMPGGHAYVYLCYGIHNLFNIVTNTEGLPEAVLIRAVEPHKNIEIMRERRRTTDKHLTSGPGKLSEALGITRKLNGIPLSGNDLWIEEGEEYREADIISTTRIGVDYAGEDAMLPWRYYIRDNTFVSKK